MYHTFSDEYNKLFRENVLSFVKNRKESSLETEEDYCLFYPSLSVPQNEQVDFLVYGQAVNGWMGSAHENFNTQELKKLIEYSNHYFSDEEAQHCPLDFVNVRWSAAVYNGERDKVKKYYNENSSQYWFSRSFFWRVVYKLVSDHYSYNRDTGNWSKKVVWSNLYKIAPARGANPDETEKAWQKETSLPLFKKELDELKPQNAILITNWSWAEPFVSYIGAIANHESPSPPIVYAGKYGGSNILVTTRPFLGNGEKHVSSLLEIIGKSKKE